MYNINVQPEYEWDERKRQINLKKHGLDFQDAWLVYENPEKLTYPVPHAIEDRRMTIANVEIAERVLTLIYVERNAVIRIISFRPASRKERRIYETEKSDGLGTSKGI
jgi:uncharacterized DUF497 family protein